MEIPEQIIQKIEELTSTIGVNYPELYIFLDEDPITISNTKNPKITSKILNEYLESLKMLLTNYKKTHRSK